MSNNSSSSGVGITGLLLVAFIVLKLVGVIDWSWWWVMAPLWGHILLWILIVGVILLYEVFKSKPYKKKLKDIRKEKPNRFQQRMDEMVKEAEENKN